MRIDPMARGACPRAEATRAIAADKPGDAAVRAGDRPGAVPLSMRENLELVIRNALGRARRIAATAGRHDVVGSVVASLRVEVVDEDPRRCEPCEHPVAPMARVIVWTDLLPEREPVSGDRSVAHGEWMFGQINSRVGGHADGAASLCSAALRAIALTLQRWLGAQLEWIAAVSTGRHPLTLAERED